MMNTYKRVVVAMLVALGLMAVASRPALAAFVSIGKSSTTATVTFTGTGQTLAGIQVRNISDNNLVNGGVGPVTWSTTTATLGYAAASILDTATNGASVAKNAAPFIGWAVAAQYIQLNTTFTALGSGVQIYTNNESTTAPYLANPRYVGTSTTQVAGLLMSTATTTTYPALPMAWAVTPNVITSTDTSIMPPVMPYDSGQETLAQAALVPNCFAWSYFGDPMSATGSTGWSQNGTDFTTVKNWQGNHYSQGAGNYGGTQSTAYIYLEANFNGAAFFAPYTTNELTVEAYQE